VNDSEQFLSLLRSRRSIRRFLDRPVPRAILDRLIEAATWAPSASNRQDWQFTVVESGDLKKRMAEAVSPRWLEVLGETDAASIASEVQSYTEAFDWFHRAPAVIVISAKQPEAFLDHLFGDDAAVVAGSSTSAAMAGQNLMLAAHAEGLGSCCLTGPLAAELELKELLGLGRRRQIVCLIALGYPDESPDPPARKPVDQIVRYVS